MRNRLFEESSPYLLQHAENPVDWYPWGNEALFRARTEDKPIFLSIGYSTCHWCHVMAHECFEDGEIAALLNSDFISIKVDREERPDLDGVYMRACQAFTGGGGWPMSVFLTPAGKPFYAGTYYPKQELYSLLTLISDKWLGERQALEAQAEQTVSALRAQENAAPSPELSLAPAEEAARYFLRSYDAVNGGFEAAPKFPSPQNLLFLLKWHEHSGEKKYLDMVLHTVTQMYRGGLFDHIGFGFCRYSTDRRFLVPHFEKMLYDNALMVYVCCKVYESSGRDGLFLSIAEKTAEYMLRELRSPDGGFYAAQDADSERGEGAFYLFTPEETSAVLGEKDAEAFNRRFGITERGNFHGGSLPNLLGSDVRDESADGLIPPVREYRKGRMALKTDDKILTAWNSLAIASLCALYKVSGNGEYLEAAQDADRFIRKRLTENGTLYVSFRGKRSETAGFLDDYAARIFSLIELYEASSRREYLDEAERLCRKTAASFGDPSGGFYFSGSENEPLVLRPKETYDGAVPSGNSLMAMNLVRLSRIIPGSGYAELAERQLKFLTGAAKELPAGSAMFLTALTEFIG